MKYKKTENNTWASLVYTCEDKNIQLVDIIIHTKYPIDSKRLFDFSLIQPQSNVNCGLILHDYECTEMTLDETRPSIFTENEWEYFLPYWNSMDYGVYLWMHFGERRVVVGYWRVLRDNFWPPFSRQNCHIYHRLSVAWETTSPSAPRPYRIRATLTLVCWQGNFRAKPRQLPTTGFPWLTWEIMDSPMSMVKR